MITLLRGTRLGRASECHRCGEICRSQGIRNRCNANGNEDGRVGHSGIWAEHKLISRISAGSTQRAWQALPRHLRRRAASHDVRRVPVRLRERARGEVSLDTHVLKPILMFLKMDAKPIKGKSGPKRGKLKAITRTDSFLKRQSKHFGRLPKIGTDVG
jgi:Ribonucleases P/MRP protein subunit POP1